MLRVTGTTLDSSNWRLDAVKGFGVEDLNE